MEIIEYNSRYEEDVKRLLVELQEFLVKIDDEKVQILTNRYKEEYFSMMMKKVQENMGKILLSINNGEIIGMISGIIESKDEEDSITNRCPIRGKITDFVVTEKARKLGIGKILFAQMEEYLKSLDCEYIAIDVFGPNIGAQRFYEKQGYTMRNVEVMKKI